MNVGNSVRKALDDWQMGEQEAAMLHACNAVDGTASKVFPNRGSHGRFTQFLRDNYWILGPMGAPGIDLVQTRFPVTVKRVTTSDGQPDIADVIYSVHRCTHGHGDELPDGYALIEDVRGPQGRTRTGVERGSVRLSDRIIFALLGVAVLSPANDGQSVPDGYFLTFGVSAITMPVNQWWGRAVDFRILVAQEPLPPAIKMDFSNWA